jgi:hypothetical protein
MGIYQKANDLGIRLNGKEGARARMGALAVHEALDETLSELVKQSQYQSQVLHAIMQKLEGRG